MKHHKLSEEPAEMIWMLCAGYLGGAGIDGDKVVSLREHFINTAQKDISKAIRKAIREGK